jgi:threonine/homoserine/homoserine lactone efflux protein
MEGIVNYKLFLLSSIMIVAIPGQDFLYVMSRGIALGKKSGIISAVGISAGLIVHTLLATFGLSVLIQTSAVAYIVIQYCGATYLVYLGIKTLRNKGVLNAEKPSNINGKNIFMQGVLTNVFNPKAILVFIAFLPQFIDVDLLNPTRQLLFLGATLSLVAVAWFSLVGYFAGFIGAFIKKNKSVQNVARILSGSVLIGLGIRLAMQKK